MNNNLELKETSEPETGPHRSAAETESDVVNATQPRHRSRELSELDVDARDPTIAAEGTAGTTEQPKRDKNTENAPIAKHEGQGDAQDRGIQDHDIRAATTALGKRRRLDSTASEQQTTAPIGPQQTPMTPMIAPVRQFVDTRTIRHNVGDALEGLGEMTENLNLDPEREERLEEIKRLLTGTLDSLPHSGRDSSKSGRSGKKQQLRRR